ncbi:MAG: glycerol-3-phosphate 1-O-acyltransferase PlsY [Niabella sp.]
MQEILLVLIAYCLGSIPTAVWVSRHFFDIDIRDYGSGNAGATNTFRVLGPKFGSLVMVCDVLKGLLAVKLSLLSPIFQSDEILLLNFQLILGIAAVIGHIFPIWANFKGGKGVATLLGLILGISPLTALCCTGIFLLVLYMTRFVSLSSILAGIAFPVFILLIFNVGNDFYRGFAISVAVLIILTHQKNIGRILKGNENKVPIFKKRDHRKNHNDRNTTTSL